MQRWRTALATLPLPAYFLMQAVIYGGAMYLLTPLLRRPGWPWQVAVVAGAFFGFVMTWFEARRRRRMGGAHQQLRIGLAIKSGRLPEDADPSVWAPALARHEQTLRRLRKWAPLEFGLFAGLEVWLAVAEGSVWWWLFAAFFVAMTVMAIVVPPRRLAHVRELQRELEQSR